MKFFGPFTVFALSVSCMASVAFAAPNLQILTTESLPFLTPGSSSKVRVVRGEQAKKMFADGVIFKRVASELKVHHRNNTPAGGSFSSNSAISNTGAIVDGEIRSGILCYEFLTTAVVDDRPTRSYDYTCFIEPELDFEPRK